MSLLFKVMTGINVALFRWTGGKLGGKFSGTPILLLTTVGNKSGQPRTVPVMSFEDGGDHVVVASKGGSPEHPAWYKNLVKTPEVTVEVRGRSFRARAETVGAEERARLWKMVTERMARFSGYEKKTTREIPIVRVREIK